MDVENPKRLKIRSRKERVSNRWIRGPAGGDSKHVCRGKAGTGDEEQGAVEACWSRPPLFTVPCRVCVPRMGSKGGRRWRGEIPSMILDDEGGEEANAN